MQQNAETGSQGCHLRQREVHENDFAPDDVESEINQNSGQEQARDERPFHYFKCFHKIYSAERAQPGRSNTRSSGAARRISWERWRLAGANVTSCSVKAGDTRRRNGSTPSEGRFMFFS